MSISFFPRQLSYATLVVFLFLTENAWTESAQAIVVQDIQLSSTEYPWGKELGIHFKGQASPLFDSAVLTISVFYLHRRAYMFSYVIDSKASAVAKKHRRKIFIDENWEPLNAVAQEILPGKYQVKIELDMRQQSPEFTQKWYKKYGERAAWKYSENYQLCEASFDKNRYYKQGEKYDPLYKEAYDRKYRDDINRVTQELRKFYVDRMRSLNDLYREIQQQQQLALRVSQDVKRGKSNPFAIDGKFDEKKWRKWFRKVYMKKLSKERTILEKHGQKVFAPRYPTALNNMLKYASIIDRMANFMALEVYHHYQLQNGERLYQVDPQALKNKRDITRLIQRLHSSSSIELKISLRKELGYLPPPSVY